MYMYSQSIVYIWARLW